MGGCGSPAYQPRAKGVCKLEFFGEKLIIQMWNSIADKGIGSLLKPWQIQREAATNLEARRLEILVLAQAETDARDIREGRKELLPSGRLIAQSSRANPKEDGVEVTQDNHTKIVERLTKDEVCERLRKEISISKAIAYAEETLLEDESPTTEKSVSDDWLLRWRDYASNVGSDEMQNLWGRVLAGESKAPGSFSLRTLDFIRNLSISEAQLIEKVCHLCIEDSIVFPAFTYTRNYNSLLEKYDISLKDLITLSSLGIISGVEGQPLTSFWESHSQDFFSRNIYCNNKLFMVTHTSPHLRLEMPSLPLTPLGRELRILAKAPANIDYLTEVGRALKSRGFQVKIADYTVISDTQALPANIVEI